MWIIFALIILLLFHVKSYYAFRFIVMDDLSEFNSDFVDFTFGTKHSSYKPQSRSAWFILKKSKFLHAERAKNISNILLALFYVLILCLIFL